MNSFIGSFEKSAAFFYEGDLRAKGRQFLRKTAAETKEVASVAIFKGGKLLMGERRDNGKWTDGFEKVASESDAFKYDEKLLRSRAAKWGAIGAGTGSLLTFLLGAAAAVRGGASWSTLPNKVYTAQSIGGGIGAGIGMYAGGQREMARQRASSEKGYP